MQKQNGQNQSQELATIHPSPIDTGPVVSALVPTSLDGAMQFAQWLAKSSLLPKNAQKEHDIFFIVCAGMELGLPPMAALRGLYTVHGRTALESKTKAALALQKGAAVYFRRVEFTPEACTWETLRRGQTEPVKMRYTLVEAQEAGLAPDRKNNRPGKEGPWRQFTQRMISHRALGWLCDDVYPDIVMGVATAEDFDPREFTFKPIGAGVELATPIESAAPEVVPGTPTTAKNANAPKDDVPKAAVPSVSDKKAPEKPKGKHLDDPDEIADIMERLGKFTDENELRAYVEETVKPREMTDAVRDKLSNAYADQRDMIRDAARREKAGK